MKARNLLAHPDRRTAQDSESYFVARPAATVGWRCFRAHQADPMVLSQGPLVEPTVTLDQVERDDGQSFLAEAGSARCCRKRARARLGDDRRSRFRDCFAGAPGGFYK